MDNASYHSRVLDKIPTTNTKKQDVISWLARKQILHDLDKHAAEMGHEVVPLPPYHCQGSPFELIWAQVKGEVADKNKTFKINDV